MVTHQWRLKGDQAVRGEDFLTGLQRPFVNAFEQNQVSEKNQVKDQGLEAEIVMWDEPYAQGM